MHAYITSYEGEDVPCAYTVTEVYLVGVRSALFHLLLVKVALY